MHPIFYAVIALSLVGLASSAAFIPNNDLIVVNSDGELIAVFGEHGFYQDTIFFGSPISYSDGIVNIGDHYAGDTAESRAMAKLPFIA